MDTPNVSRFQRVMRASGQYVLLFALLVGLLWISGSQVRWQQVPDIKPRVLSLFTDVQEGYVRVLEVVDGDTIVISAAGDEQTVRLLGVDTPEIKDPRRAVQCFGQQASSYTKQLVSGRAVRLETDPMESDRDAYGRLLRYVYFEDGTTLNERLVYEGYAFAYEKYPTKMLEKLKNLEADARVHKRGLWGGCEVTIKNKGKSKSTNALRE